MIPRNRKGMIIKNTNKRTISVKLDGRKLDIQPGEQVSVTADEVMDNALRDLLQVRDLAIVRPLSDEENKEVQKNFGSKSRKPKPKTRG